jgi:NADH-quinone oxidoreductase subunit M
VGVLYDRLHTREISRYGGIVSNMPVFAALFMIFMLASVGLPGTSGFVGEFLTLLGAFQVNTLATLFAATGLIFGAAYMLFLYRRVVFGPAVNKDAMEMPDINMREKILLVPLILLVLWLGIFPGTVMSRIEPSVKKLSADYQSHVQAAPAKAEEAVDQENAR